jgi:hypothetical protein
MDSYTAGLIDGEGYLGISHVKAADTYNIRIQVAMVTKSTPVLSRLHALYGGRMTKRPPETEANAEKDAWVLDGAEAYSLLLRVRPHLILKADQATCLVDLWESILKNRAAKGRLHWDDSLRRHARHLMLRVQEGNQRGPQAPEPTLPGRRPLAVRRWGEWWEPDDDLFGPVTFRGRLPNSGTMRSGRMYAQPMWEHLTADSASSSSPGLLPTPLTTDGRSNDSPGALARKSPGLGAISGLLPTPTASDRFGPGDHGDGGLDLRTAVGHAPADATGDGRDEGWAEPAGLVGDLMLPSAVMDLLPTPTAMDSKDSRNSTVQRSSTGSKKWSPGDTLTDWCWKHEGWTGATTSPPSADGSAA